MINNKEIWLSIKGYEGLYEVSNYGNVRSLKFGKIRYLKPANNGNGYNHVILWKNGIKKDFTVHRLVANAFIENPNGYNEINHINEVKTDNKASNLEWCDRQHNVRHSQAKQVMGIGKNGRKTILLEATRDGDLLGYKQSAVANAARGEFHKIGNHKYKDFDWFYIPKGLYDLLLSIPNLSNDYQTVIIPKNDMIEYR